MAHAAGGRKTILLVENEEDIRALLRHVLLREGYRVLEAVDGTEGVEVALQAAPDLILMDLAMPVMNGIDAARVLKKHPATAEIPVVAITASTWFSSDRKALQRAGFAAVLPKPYQTDRLLAEIQRLLPS